MDELFKTLTKIHKPLFKNFTYISDKKNYGVIEKWDIVEQDFDVNTKFKGDCECFALHCRKLCRDAGLQTRLVACSVNGEGHCVLECDGWVLDNRFNKVMSKDTLEKHEGYKWLAISGFEAGEPWHNVE